MKTFYGHSMVPSGFVPDPARPWIRQVAVAVAARSRAAAQRSFAAAGIGWPGNDYISVGIDRFHDRPGVIFWKTTDASRDWRAWEGLDPRAPIDDEDGGRRGD